MLWSIAGRSAATAATIDVAGAGLWNGHASARVWVMGINWAQTVATVSNLSLVRTTARGTATVTVTPDIDSAWERDISPPSGCLLDTAYSAQPTLAPPSHWRWNLPAAIGSGFMERFPGEGICVPFGTGLAITTPVAVILQPADVTFIIRE